ncbi:MAG: AAA family ATPase, partial [Gammaproteobacteria bacterium]|nr:AAA family ATPase [Gammaproteobacteria bacterium]
MSPSEPANTPPDRGPEISEAYFSSPDLVQRADLLRHLTENSNLIPLVRGVEGIGKSTFIGHLLDLAPQNWMTVEIKADVMLQPEALLAKLARLYGLNDAAEGLLEGLAVHFDHLRQDGFLPVIVIDDAELLPEASIITLLRLHQQGPNDDPLAQILLFAQREIDSLLKTPQLKAMNLQPVQLLDMPLFTREQTEHFLEHLLAANESIHLSPAQAEKIFRETRGMPGLIKRRAAELTDSQETKRITFDVIEYLPIRTAIGGGIALLVVLLGLVYQDSINSMFTSNDGAPEVGQDALVAAGRTQPLALPSLTDESVSVLEEAGVEGARLSAPHSMGAAVVDPGGEQPVESMPVAGVDQAPLAAEPDVGEHQAQEEGSAAPVEEADPAKTETESTAERVAAPELAEVPEPEPVEHKEMESSGTEPEQAVTAGQEDSAAAEVAVPPS